MGSTDASLLQGDAGEVFPIPFPETFSVGGWAAIRVESLCHRHATCSEEETAVAEKGTCCHEEERRKEKAKDRTSCFSRRVRSDACRWRSVVQKEVTTTPSSHSFFVEDKGKALEHEDAAAVHAPIVVRSDASGPRRRRCTTPGRREAQNAGNDITLSRTRMNSTNISYFFRFFQC